MQEFIKLDIGEIEDSNTAFNKQATVIAKMPIKEWQKIRKKSQLGMLYGVDISNEVYRKSDRKIKAYNPVVEDRTKAKAGIKTIELTYYWNET